MTDRSDKLRSLVNASGFAFQLAVEAAVRNSDSTHKWSVHAREYPWQNRDKLGFVDLILKRKEYFLVVECKRQREAEWVFLMPDQRQRSRTHARICWTSTAPHRSALSDWDDIQIDPGSPEVEFCIVRGQGEKDRPMLERLASPLIESVEAVALDLLRVSERSTAHGVLVPVILTNASLYLCKFKPGDIDLAEGDVDKGIFVEVPSVRFSSLLNYPRIPADLWI